MSNFWKNFDQRMPQPLTAERTKLPSHLALLLVAGEEIEEEAAEKSFVECIVRAVRWCQAVGIKQLTVYDSQAVTLNCSQSIRTRLIASQQRNVLKRRKPKYDAISTIPLTLNLVSRGSSKPAIASLAQSYAWTPKRISHKTNADLQFELSADELGSTLEGRHGLPSPDFMIIHHISQLHNNHASLELHGFPPWQIQLTELYLNSPAKSKWSWLRSSSLPSLLEEEEFRAALDEFSNVEMRLGK